MTKNVEEAFESFNVSDEEIFLDAAPVMQMMNWKLQKPNDVRPERRQLLFESQVCNYLNNHQWVSKKTRKQGS